MTYERMTAAQAARRVSAGERLEYVIEWSNGWYGGKDVIAFDPDTTGEIAANVAHQVKCAVFDRRGTITRRGWRSVTA
jgi:hypothetical protein